MQMLIQISIGIIQMEYNSTAIFDVDTIILWSLFTYNNISTHNTGKNNPICEFRSNGTEEYNFKS